METQSKSIQYLEWRLAKAEEMIKKNKDAWLQDSIEYYRIEEHQRREIETLTANVQAAEIRESELKAKIMFYETETQKKNKDIVELRRSIEIDSAKHANVQLELRECLKKEKKEYEELKLNMQADIDKMQQELKQQEKLSEKLKLKVIKLEIDKQAYDKWYRMCVEGLQNTVATAEEERRKQMEEEDRIKSNIMSHNQMEIAIYERKLTDLQGELARRENLSRLVTNVDHFHVTIEKQKQQIEALQQELNEVGPSEGTKVDGNDSVEVKLMLAKKEINNLKEKLLDEETREKCKTKVKQKELDFIKSQNKSMAEEVFNLKKQLMNNEAGSRLLKVKVKTLETNQKKLKEDLQACTLGINDPKVLKQKIITLTKRYLEDDKRVQIPENMESLYKVKIDCLWKQLDEYQELLQAGDISIKELKQKLASTMKILNEKERRYTKLLNEEAQKVYNLQQELKRTKFLLQKSTKQVPQRILRLQRKNSHSKF